MFRPALLLWMLITTLAPAQSVLAPPFGLKWGDSPEKLIDWAARHALDVEIRLPGKNPELRIVRISPQTGLLPSSQARSVEGRFQSGRLFEVSVHYGGAHESAVAVEDQFGELRRALAKEHGTLSPNRQDKTVDDQFSTRTVSFHREPVKGVFLLLAFTEVEDLLRKRKEATFSLVYRNDNLRQLIESSRKPEPEGP